MVAPPVAAIPALTPALMAQGRAGGLVEADPVIVGMLVIALLLGAGAFVVVRLRGRGRR